MDSRCERRFGILALFLFVLAGCAETVPDARNSPEIIARAATAVPRATTELRGDLPNPRLYEQGNVEPYTGWVKGFYPDGTLRLLEYYREGQLEGMATKWYADGRRQCVGHYRDGLLEGTAKTWHENGERQGESQLAAGKLHGELILWDPQGREVKREHYRHGVRVP